MKALRKEVRVETLAPARTAGHRAQRTSFCRTSGFCRRSRLSGKNRAGSCSNQTGHAGSCLQLRQCQDADKRKRDRRDTDGAQTASLERRWLKARKQRPGPRVRRRQLPPWAARKPSSDSLQKAFSKDGQFFADAKTDLARKHLVIEARNLFEQTAVNSDQHPEGRLTVFVYER